MDYGEDIGKTRERLWRIAATATWIEHVRISGGSDDLPATFQLSRLSWWASTFLKNAVIVLREELTTYGVTLHLAESSGGADHWTLSRIGAVGGLQNLLADICAPLSSMKLDWLRNLSGTVGSIGEIIIDAMGDTIGDLSALRKVQVSHAVMFGEEWSTPYEVCWQADGAGNAIIMPDLPNFSDRHFTHFANSLGHTHPGQTLLYQYLSTYVIPCHEVLHIVQHLHGGMRDSDPQSYAMEHDASRLNYILLWQVLQRDETLPEWFRNTVMLQAVNLALAAQKGFEEKFRDKYVAYRSWADSFGLNSPAEVYAQDSSDNEKLRLESLSKFLVAGEALACRGGREPTMEHLNDLLGAAFSPSRKGDVYSPENREVVVAALPIDLQLTPTVGAMLSSPASLADHELVQLSALLQANSSTEVDYCSTAQGSQLT